jgi:hypothetical protein
VRLLDEISHGPERDFRLPSGRWPPAAAAAGILAVAAALAVTGVGDHQGAHTRSVGAPGTFLLTCDSATWEQLNPNWRSLSLRVGPLWFADSNQSGYVRDGGSPDTVGTVTGGTVTGIDTVMPLEVAAGSTVVMKAPSGTRSYFHFLIGFGAETTYSQPSPIYPQPSPLPSGETGYTFVACPQQHADANGRVTDFLFVFSIDAGRAAPVEVWTSASSRPMWVTLTASSGIPLSDPRPTPPPKDGPVVGSGEG